MKDRIKKIMDKVNLNTAEFAFSIGINVTTLNAALNRNQTINSTIIQAIMQKYPDFNAEWIMIGTGPMMKGDKVYLEPSLFVDNEINEANLPERNEYRRDLGDKKLPKSPKQAKSQELINGFSTSKKIDKIVIFYTDNTFMSLTPEE